MRIGQLVICCGEKTATLGGIARPQWLYGLIDEVGVRPIVVVN